MEAPGKYLVESDIRQHWGPVREGLQEIIDKAPGKQDWMPEDVYAAVVNGDATLLMDDEGFVVLKPKRAEFSNEMKLLIWIAHSRVQGFQERIMPQLNSIARNMKVQQLVCLSYRKGLEKTGWQIDHIYYKRDVQ